MIDASPAEPGSTLEGNRMTLSTRHREWLANLPLKREFPGEILIFHGTPTRDNVYLLESVRSNGIVSPATDKEIAARLGRVSETLLLCGHTHIPRAAMADGRLIVNPGSVGLPAYSDVAPVPHVMETGTPHARYATLERTGSGWRVDHIAIDYDVESAAEMADRNRRPDWAGRLRTGRAVMA